MRNYFKPLSAFGKRYSFAKHLLAFERLPLLIGFITMAFISSFGIDQNQPEATGFILALVGLFSFGSILIIVGIFTKWNELRKMFGPWK